MITNPVVVTDLNALLRERRSKQDSSYARLVECTNSPVACFTALIAEVSYGQPQGFFRRRASEKISQLQIGAVSVLGLALDGTDLAGASLGAVPPPPLVWVFPCLS